MRGKSDDRNSRRRDARRQLSTEEMRSVNGGSFKGAAKQAGKQILEMNPIYSAVQVGRHKMSVREGLTNIATAAVSVIPGAGEVAVAAKLGRLAAPAAKLAKFAGPAGRLAADPVGSIVETGAKYAGKTAIKALTRVAPKAAPKILRGAGQAQKFAGRVNKVVDRAQRANDAIRFLQTANGQQGHDPQLKVRLKVGGPIGKAVQRVQRVRDAARTFAQEHPVATQVAGAALRGARRGAVAGARASSTARPQQQPPRPQAQAPRQQARWQQAQAANPSAPRRRK
jgi:hypothetical protein